MLKKLKSYFIVDDDEFKEKMAGGEKGKVEQPKQQNTRPVTTNPSASNSTPRPSTGKPEAKFTNILLGAMDANNIEGFDYLEYKQSLHNLAKMPMDEATRYKSAFAAAQTMGATPQKLIDTAQFYIDILKKEEAKFASALANQRMKQIGDKEQQIKQHDNLIKEKTQRIEQLKKEIQQHAAQRDAMKKNISEATVKVESTKNNFMASFNLLISQINKDKENMKKYLK